MALIGGAYANRRAGKHIITTRIEHASVHEPLAFLEELGYQVTYLPVDKNGQVSPSELEKALTEETILVSIMLVNNEIGAVEDVKTLSEIVHSYNPKILFHVDAIQAYGKYHIVPKRLGIDLMSVSGHKLHGPKGVGFLYMRDKAKVRPLIYGGGQQGISFRYGKCSGDCRLGCGSRAVLQKQINLCGTDVCLQETFDRGTGSTRRCDGQWRVRASIGRDSTTYCQRKFCRSAQ